MATIGRNKAVADIGKFKTAGFFAWIMWLFVHLVSLVGFRNKVIVTLNWFWNYITYDQSLRVIIGGNDPEDRVLPEKD
jgi:NADH dehydrogenase